LVDISPFRQRRSPHTCSSFTPPLHHQIHPWNRWFPLTLTLKLPDTVCCPVPGSPVRGSAIRNSQAPSLLTRRSLVRNLFGGPNNSHLGPFVCVPVVRRGRAASRRQCESEVLESSAGSGAPGEGETNCQALDAGIRDQRPCY